MWLAAGVWAAAFSISVGRLLSPLCTPIKRALSLPNDPLTMLREIIALWAIWTLLCPFLTLTVTWLKIFLDEMIDENFLFRLDVILRSKARFDRYKITITCSRSSEAVSHKTSLSRQLSLLSLWLSKESNYSLISKKMQNSFDLIARIKLEKKKKNWKILNKKIWIFYENFWSPRNLKIFLSPRKCYT